MNLPLAGFGDVATVQMELDAWLRTLSGLRAALRSARAAGNVAMESQVRSGVVNVLQRVVVLHQQMKESEMPSSVMRSLASLGDGAMGVARQVGGVSKDLLDAVDSIVKGLGGVGRMLPLLVVGALVVIGLGFHRGSLKVGLPLP